MAVLGNRDANERPSQIASRHNFRDDLTVSLSLSLSLATVIRPVTSRNFRPRCFPTNQTIRQFGIGEAYRILKRAHGNRFLIRGQKSAQQRRYDRLHNYAAKSSATRISVMLGDTDRRRDRAIDHRASSAMPVRRRIGDSRSAALASAGVPLDLEMRCGS